MTEKLLITIDKDNLNVAIEKGHIVFNHATVRMTTHF